MAIKDALLPEFDHEMQVTRAHLAVVPEAKADWKPHAKSMSLGQLARHIAEVPGWVGVTLGATEMDLNPPGGPAYVPPKFEGTARSLEVFDAAVAQGRAMIAAASDADFMVTWSLKNAGKVAMSMPRAAVLRSFVMNHMIHHRGQLTVYLRQLEVPVPSSYGPTADAPGGMGG
jgi:uncharacterized damage-inducible protein DinB